jgi:hypothetical protein
MYLGSPSVNRKTLLDSLGGYMPVGAKWPFTFRFSLVPAKDVVSLEN